MNMIPYTALHHYGKGNESQRPLFDGVQRKYLFPNGFAASVVRHYGSYGGDHGLWELAVLDINGNIRYDTPITSDVEGWLTEHKVQVLLHRIWALNPA